MICVVASRAAAALARRGERGTLRRILEARMAETRGALEGLRVIDLSTTVAGAWCTRLLADFGADVILLEAKDGHPTRRLEPLTEGGKSVVAEYVLANK